MPATKSPDLDALLAHAGWAHGLAARLVRDAAAADDLAQDAWVAALERPPAPDRPLRRWLAAVLRNLAREGHRADSRRGARERAAAAAELAPSTVELVARLDAHQHLVAAVTALEEPYRATVLLRWFEDRPPREIARLHGVPVATVHTRLQRAHARLARSLDAAHGGDRAAWLAAFAPLTRTASHVALSSACIAVLMNAKLAVAATVAATLVIALTLVWRGSSSDSAPSERAPSGTAPASGAREPASAGGGEERAPAPRFAEAATSVATAPARPTDASHVRGRVVDVRGRAVPAVTVRLSSGAGAAAAADRAALAVSDERGEFDLVAPRAYGAVTVQSERWLTVLSGHVPYASEPRVVLVVAEGMELAGFVSDEAGQPVARAEIDLVLPPDLRARLREVLDDSVDESWHDVTDGQGRFRWAALPIVEGAKLRAARAGFETFQGPAPAAPTAGHAITLRHAKAPDGAITGTVLDDAERPAAGALVSWGREATVTDDAGHFHLVAPAGAKLTVTAVKAGCLPATAEVEVRAPGAAKAPELVLRLGGPLLSITGRVVDRTGRPLAAAMVWVDPTWFGTQGGNMLSTESLAARGAWSSRVDTDEQGRFEVKALLARDYTLHALEPATLRVVRRQAVPAGSRDVEVVLAGDEPIPRIAGRVVDRGGAPVAGVTVATQREAWCLRNTAASGMSGSMSDSANGPATKTTADGGFELRSVARDGVSLDVYDAAIVPVSVQLDECRDLERVVLAVSRRCHFKVELRDAAEADAFELLDVGGRTLAMTVRKGNISTAAGRMRLAAGRSEMATAEETARTIVLYRADKEVRRAPIELRSGAPTIVQP
jgi:RNA polymerase sigma-70 factor (ECF subfamily)